MTPARKPAEVPIGFFDLVGLAHYSSIGHRTLRRWLHDPDQPLPHAKVGGKILVEKAAFDRWMRQFQVRHEDRGAHSTSIVDQLTAGL